VSVPTDLPDVWIKYPRGADEETASGVWYSSPGILSDRYIPATKLAAAEAINARLVEALRARAVDETGFCDYCNTARWKHAPYCLLSPL
jgi:hypothetical protein